METVEPLYIRQDIGSGDPIVLLHGLFADGTQWETIAELLSKESRVIVVDLLGHGRSPRPEGASYNPEEHVAALRAALEQAKATKHVTLVGYSMGGPVALSYAATYHAEVQQLYLISSPFYLRPDQMIAANYAASVLVTKASQLLYRTVERLLGKERLVARVLGFANGSKAFQKMIGAHDNVLESDIIKLNIKHMVHQFNFAGRLAEVTAPTTFYAGTKDPFIVQGQLYALKKFSPYIDIQRLDIIKIDHMLVQNLPKKITKLIGQGNNNLLHVGYDEGNADGREVLVLLHGIESSSAYWKHLVPSLAEHRRVLAIDLLGFGSSPKPSNIGYTTEQHVAALHETLQSMGITRFSLAGHSMGSVISLAYAAVYPQQVRDLTLFAPVLLPMKAHSTQLAVKALQNIHYLPDMSLLYEQTVRFIGEDRLRQYVPTIRSIENTINRQECFKNAKRARHIPTKFVVGTSDVLVDGRYVDVVAKQFESRRVTKLHGTGHNFVIFKPETALQALDGDMPHQHQPRKAAVSRRSFVQQVARLAVPVLVLKSLIFLSLGLLLFTDYAATTLVIGLALYVIVKGYRVIRGAFSLRYEGLSYVGYVVLGMATIGLGYLLAKHPEKSLQIGVFIICAMIAVTGLTRVLVALAWTRSKLLSRSLLLSGLPMLLVGLVALRGSVVSIYIIIYSIAALLIARSAVYGWYAAVSLSMAYVRGFNHPLRTKH
jgi:pimeloyl-ACP methyl ester carboxylesterase/uncharacterized membrane protein HdeD (DUF308 family)